MATPANQKVEVEFVTSTWTDVTADVDWTVGVATIFGRTSQFTGPQIASITFDLNNTLGKYTPGTQVLSDGVTASTYWPNILPGKRVRYSYTVSAVQKIRFMGYIVNWPPLLTNGVYDHVTITANDRLDILSQVNLDGVMLQAAQTDSASLIYTLGDAASSTEAVGIGINTNPLTPFVVGSGGGLTFGVNGPDDEQLTGILFTPTNVSNGQYIFTGASGVSANFYDAPNRINNGASTEVWFKTTSNPAIGSPETIYYLSTSNALAQWTQLLLLNGGLLQVQTSTTGPLAGAAIFSPATVVNDGAWHQVIVGGSTTHSQMWIDGQPIGAASGSPQGVYQTTPNVVYVAVTPTQVIPLSLFAGAIAFLISYPQYLSNTQALAHYTARLAVAGDTTGTRIARYLTYAGVAAGEMTIDAGQQIIGNHSLLASSKDVVTAANELADTEGGDAVFYVLPNGNVRFADRTYRKAAAPVMTLDAQKDLVADTWVPSFDRLGLLRQSTVTRSGAGPSTYVNSAAAATNGAETFTSYCNDDASALQLASFRVNSRAFPALRVPQIKLNLTTAQTSGLDAALALLQIGDRIRVINVPAGITNGSRLDLIVEGWAESPSSLTGYPLVMNTSRADSPARGIWDSTSYGRWRGDAANVSQLNGSITAAATSLSVAWLTFTSLYPQTFSTTSGDYPLNIMIGTEVLTLTTAPGGSTSPQSFTGVTRGVNNTFAAAHASGANVDLWPAGTWSG